MKAIGLAAAVAILALAGAAHAQQKCSSIGGGMPLECHPTGMAAIDALGSDSAPPHQARSAPPDPSSVMALCPGGLITGAACRRGYDQERRQVGGLMANGDCSGAMKRALQEADFYMARTVKELCLATPSH